MSASCEVTQGVGDTWATCPTLLRGIWARSRSGRVSLLRSTMIKCNFEKNWVLVSLKIFFRFQVSVCIWRDAKRTPSILLAISLVLLERLFVAKVFPRTFIRWFILVNPCKQLPLCWTPTKTIEQFDASPFSETLLLLSKPHLKANCSQINSVYWSLQCIRSGIQKVRPKHFANICRF